MKRLVFYSALAVILIGIVGARYLVEIKSRHLPSVAEAITQPISQEPVVGLHAYGKYSFVLAPHRKLDNEPSRRLVWSPPSGNETTFTNFEESVEGDVVKVTLECHTCYANNFISGGTLRFLQGKTVWEMGFHHVGAESVFYSEELPPGWVLACHSSLDLLVDPDVFLDSFHDLYQASRENNRPSQIVASRKISRQLVQAFVDHYSR